MDILFSLLPWIPALLGVIALGFLATRFIVNVGPTEIAITERRFLGKKLPSNRAFATSGEVGIQAAYLSPGLHFIFWPITRVIKKAPFVVIGSGQLGVITATDGESMPSGRVYAEDAAGENHGSFQDPTGFLTNGGIRGKQLRFLTNGTFKIHPYLFQVELIDKTVVPEGSIGVVTAADGASLIEGQLLGQRANGHDNFQKGETFLKNGGQKGPQIDFLRPGTYNIFSDMFKVDVKPAVQVKENQIGIVEAKAGDPMGKDDVVGASPEMSLHMSYQDGQAFLNAGGKRGPQEEVLRPGTYYVNPYLFSVTMQPQTVIKQGEVGVMISNIGKDPAELFGDDGTFQNHTVPAVVKAPASADTSVADSSPLTVGATDPEETRHNTGVRARHVVPKGYRGIQKDVLNPGKYNINPLAYTVIVVPTTTRSIEWSENAGAKDFDPFAVVSRDGFMMQVEVRCQYRILPENAPYVVQKLGSVEELEKNVLHPQIDGIFRAQVSKSPAINYQQERATEQLDAENAVKSDLVKYKVEVVSVMICNIKLPQELMHTTQERNLAQQRETMFDAQEKAEKRRIEFQATKSQADQQDTIVKAKAGIEVAKHEAAQMEERAKGKAAQTRIEAEADAGRVKTVGDAEAGVIKAKGEATAEAYAKQVEALTAQGVTSIEVTKLLTASGQALVPQVVAGGDNNGGGNGLVNLLLADTLVRNREENAAARELKKPAADAAPAADKK
jgi:regulator of protease activity HflC (stomatin/prohibitin superfamily)